MAETMVENISPPPLPKHASLRNFLLDELKSGRFKPGDRFYGYDEIKKHQGVSGPTVSKVIGELAKEGWLEATRGSGIYVRKTEQTKEKVRTKQIGLVLPAWQLEYTPGYFYDLLHGVSAESDAHHWRLELIHGDNSEQKHYSFADKILDRIKDGLIWINPGSEYLLNLARLHDRSLPVVCTGRSYPSQLLLPTVKENIKQFAELTIQTFQRCGHHRFAALMGPESDEKMNEVAAALQSEADRTEVEIVFNYWNKGQGDHAACTETFVSRNPQLNAFFLHSPYMMKFLPGIVTSHSRNFSDSELTIVVQNADRAHLGSETRNIYELSWSLEEMGRRAVRLLDAVMSGKTEPDIDPVPVTLKPYRLAQHGPPIP